MVKQNIYRTASHIHLFLGNSLLLNHRNTLLFWVPTLPFYQLAWENNWTKKVFKYIMEVDWLTWRQTCKKIEFPKHSYSTILLWSMFLPQFSTLTGISKHLLFAANFSHSLYITLLISFVWNTLHILFICLLYTSLFICFIHYTHPCSFFSTCIHVLSCFSRVRLFATLWTAAHQAPLSVGILQARILE